MRRMRRDQHNGRGWLGFTLIEMLVVITIMAIVIGLAGVMASREAANRWRMKRAMAALHDLRTGMLAYGNACPGPMYSDAGNEEDALKDLLINGSSAKVWPTNATCQVGTASGQAKGLQDFLSEDMVTVPGGAWIDDNKFDMIFNVEESDATNCASAYCPSGFEAFCPYVQEQGYLVMVESNLPAFGAAGSSNQAKRLNPPRMILCGAVAIGPGYHAGVFMDGEGLGEKDINGNTLPNGCASGPWCMEVNTNNGSSYQGCCPGYAR